MSLSRIYEENEVKPDLRRIFVEIRHSLDLPFVPTLFKVSAGDPDYLKTMWDDLRHVARSVEFQAAVAAYDEYLRSLVIKSGWRFGDQQKLLVAQKFAPEDIIAVAGLLRIFSRTLAQMSLFTRLMQRCYSGGQRGRVSEARQVSMLARMGTLNIPTESESGLRSWMIFNDFKKTTGARNVPSVFRVLAAFPGYLASNWQEAKKVMAEPGFERSREEAAKRAMGLITRMPVRDHRAAGRGITHERWRDIEEMVDGYARFAPPFALVTLIWLRSFPSTPEWGRAAA